RHCLELFRGSLNKNGCAAWTAIRMMNNKVATFTLGDVRVIPAHNELTAFGRSCRLQPRVMEVLCYLAEHHERVIANEELTEQVWRGRVVTHGSVQKSINLLRNAFAELIGEQ